MRLHPDDYADHRNNPDALDMNPLALLTRRDWIILALAALWIAGFVFWVALWLFSAADARPIGCEAYRGAEMAACVTEGRA